MHCKDLVEFLKVKLTIMRGRPMPGSPSDLSPLSLQQSVNYNSRFPTLSLVLIEVSACGSVVMLSLSLKDCTSWERERER